MVFQARVGQTLLDAGFITPDQLRQAQESADNEGKRLTDIMVEQHLISPEVLTTVLSFQFKVPVVNLKQIEIKPEILKLIPEEFAREHQVLPVGVGPGGELQVAMENPNDFGFINTLSAMTERSIRPALPLDIPVRDMLNVIYKAVQEA